VSGPVGSAYPGNFVMLMLACLFLIASARSALSAYRHPKGTRTPQSREVHVGASVVTFLASVFAFYAIWVHR
jgi:hypothetical protein